MNFAHVGFGRSASTLLNRSILPKISEFTGHKFLISKSNLNETNSIISSTSMIAENWWNPKTYIECFEKNKKNLKKDTHIIIVIRRPLDIMTSIYLHYVARTLNTVKPKIFFSNDDQVIDKWGHYNWPPSLFNYNKIIDMYRNYFDKVSVLKYESDNINYLTKNIFQLEDKHRHIITNLSKINYNKSLSNNSIKILFGLNFICNKVGLSLTGITDFRVAVKLKYNSLYKFTKVINPYFYLKILDIFFFKNSYSIKAKGLDFDFEKSFNEYEKLPDFITYDNKNLVRGSNDI